MRFDPPSVRSVVAVLAVLAGLAGGCASGPPANGDPAEAARVEVLARLDRYMDASRAVDAAAISMFYSKTGTLFEPGIEPIVSADAIRAFIESFPGAKVEVATATPDRIEVFGDTVLIWGTYHERLSFPGQPVSEQDGKFVMEWKRGEDGVWLVERLFRVPLPPRSP